MIYSSIQQSKTFRDAILHYMNSEKSIAIKTKHVICDLAFLI